MHFLKPRAPVVTIMGHVDHGKTTLLDTLRKTSVVSTEAGGITQHIGAFSVKLQNGSYITFIDTPGHAAFEKMRARGAHVTDVIVLVVAADDGVMPQTIECINHANDANVPVIVAINKIDVGRKANVSRVKEQLLGLGLQLEEFGGDVQAVEISSLTGLNIELLTEAISTHSEIAILRADFTGPAEGVILESRKEKGRGGITTLLVQRGVLRQGSVVVAGSCYGKVRQLLNDAGKPVSEAVPSTPVQVLGWKSIPDAGEILLEVESENIANKVVNYRKNKQKNLKTSKRSLSEMTDDLEVMMKNFSKTYDDSDRLDIIIKGDVNGSLEAILDAIKTYKVQKPKLSILSAAIGPVTENDIRLLEPFKGMLFCFNVSISKDLQKLAQKLEVKVYTGQVIYHLLQSLKDEMSLKLPLVSEDIPVGEATVLQVFHLSGKRKASVAGCRVKQGQLKKKEMYRVYRNSNVIFEGHLSSMKRGDDDTDLAKKETECGLCFANFRDIQEGDRVECFSRTWKKQEVEWKWKF
ncbi:translation initiation factor IF-2, mitochondrial-like [Xenia sp. Carnegie-2017]|uniref:translation initiation factor IF-2, mitochondrial-like n=1 Tax=Xenia sp. Carnegie-2017 TaxID=2897299 RepID=UPI001F04F5E9|nr:translation initiation factor IF-2, mitochondrial-like [Xenia sp. Carnegie-2017]XP_046849306.1 translation initiation factor IF-2, mitochondrial-like [Xenia sp. Carnegie-2017]XP_046849307.1 translation initiation factor IF-2, mitochondrial-like [Xenia sp. Carnegie-2017]